jgi:hypothetical protein
MYVCDMRTEYEETQEECPETSDFNSFILISSEDLIRSGLILSYMKEQTTLYTICGVHVVSCDRFPRGSICVMLIHV